MVKLRVEESGSIRDTGNGKHEALGFIHPYNDYSFNCYMHKHRLLPDGSYRDSFNWQKGFKEWNLLNCLRRHTDDLFYLSYGFHVYEERGENEVIKHVLRDPVVKLPDNWVEITVEDACNAIRFNEEAYKLQYFKKIGRVPKLDKHVIPSSDTL